MYFTATSDEYIKNPTNIDITELTHKSSESSNIKCDIVVFKGQIQNSEGTTKDVSIKLRRRSTQQNEHLSENEASNLFEIDSNEQLRVLFPLLLGVFYFNDTGQDNLWEGIISEYLEKVDFNYSEITSVNYMVDFFHYLHTLHYNGYIHGDVHLGNFMKQPVTNLLKFIDPDDMMKLPQQQSAVNKYLIQMDLLYCLFMCSPHIKIFKKIAEQSSDNKAFEILYQYNTTMSLLIPPWGAFSLRPDTELNLYILLNSNEARCRTTHQLYWVFLNSMTIQSIYDFFWSIFSDPQFMKQIEIESRNRFKQLGVY